MMKDFLLSGTLLMLAWLGVVLLFVDIPGDFAIFKVLSLVTFYVFYRLFRKWCSFD